MVKRGAGEILINVVNREGTLLGPDLNILSKINNLDVPLIYSGGISSLANIKDVIDAGADAAAAGSFCIPRTS